MRLKEISINDEDVLDLMIAWGIDPMRELIEILAETIEEMDPDEIADKRLRFVQHELLHKLSDMEETLYRFGKRLTGPVPQNIKARGKKAMAHVAKESILKELGDLENADFDTFKKEVISILTSAFDTLFEHEDRIQGVEKAAETGKR